MVNQKQIGIRQLARSANISVRTLHHYDQIGLLVPHRRAGNNYRLYDQSAIYRLQQILFYKEMGFDLGSIKNILDDPDFDFQKALQQHRLALQAKLEGTKQLIQTIDDTLDQMKGKRKMNDNEYFTGFSDEQQAIYEKEAGERWGTDIVKESNRRWKSLTPSEKEKHLKKGEEITLALRDAIGEKPASAKVQSLINDWRQYINFFYDCTPQILLGLGHVYIEDPRFRAFYEKVDPDLPQFFYEAIKIYCEKHGVKD
jgi:DNA-binding transcriptional MerR regulator